ncbi:hypothetical protein [Candidatus Poriferisocius sp.]|uniref:hypothetical protein n=1 Tax=Candidatus Poriferisocius sp. TaxID=3101276 RepID=UPI003B01CCDC
MSIGTEPTLTITTEKTEVGSLREGDLLHYTYPSPHYRVVRNERRGNLLSPNRRSAVTLADCEGVEKRLLLSPKREVSRVTNPAVPVGPWFFYLTGTDISDNLRSWQQEDALWHKALWPLAKPFVQLWRELLDLQCRAYALKLQTGFLSVLVITLAVIIGLMTGTPDEFSVPIGLVGGFSLERYWQHWHAKTRRKLAKGTSMRVQYKPNGPHDRRYGTLELRPRGAVILGEETLHPWFSTEMCLNQGKRVLATCAFSNCIRRELTITNTQVAEAIRHRLDNGSNRVIYASSPKHKPAEEGMPDITIFPSDRWVNLDFPDRETGSWFSVTLKLHQARVLADVLEVMDEGRRT